MSAKFEDVWINMIGMTSFLKISKITMKYTVLKDGRPLFLCIFHGNFQTFKHAIPNILLQISVNLADIFKLHVLFLMMVRSVISLVLNTWPQSILQFRNG